MSCIKQTQKKRIRRPDLGLLAGGGPTTRLEDAPQPVCPLRLSLHGHPDTGGPWERHCHEALARCQFVANPDWPSVYWNVKDRVALMVYVDDFEAAGTHDALSST